MSAHATSAFPGASTLSLDGASRLGHFQDIQQEMRAGSSKVHTLHSQEILPPESNEDQIFKADCP